MSCAKEMRWEELTFSVIIGLAAAASSRASDFEPSTNDV
jgi:hypothetical protein